MDPHETPMPAVPLENENWTLPSNVQQRKSLYELPTEIRLIILRYFLVLDGPLEFWAHCSTRELTSRARAFNQCKIFALLKCRSLNLGFLCTCRQAHAEGSEVFYGENAFRFSARNGHLIANLFTLKVNQQHYRRLKTFAVPMPFSETSYGLRHLRGRHAEHYTPRYSFKSWNEDTERD